MKLLCVLLPVAVFLCSCASRAVITKPGGAIVDQAGRPYNVYKDGKWQLIRPLPRWYDEMMNQRVRGIPMAHHTQGSGMKKTMPARAVPGQ